MSVISVVRFSWFSSFSNLRFVHRICDQVCNLCLHLRISRCCLKHLIFTFSTSVEPSVPFSSQHSNLLIWQHHYCLLFIKPQDFSSVDQTIIQHIINSSPACWHQTGSMYHHIGGYSINFPFEIDIVATKLQPRHTWRVSSYSDSMRKISTARWAPGGQWWMTNDSHFIHRCSTWIERIRNRSCNFTSWYPIFSCIVGLRALNVVPSLFLNQPRASKLWLYQWSNMRVLKVCTENFSSLVTLLLL